MTHAGGEGGAVHPTLPLPMAWPSLYHAAALSVAGSEPPSPPQLAANDTGGALANETLVLAPGYGPDSEEEVSRAWLTRPRCVGWAWPRPTLEAECSGMALTGRSAGPFR